MTPAGASWKAVDMRTTGWPVISEVVVIVVAVVVVVLVSGRCAAAPSAMRYESMEKAIAMES